MSFLTIALKGVAALVILAASATAAQAQLDIGLQGGGIDSTGLSGIDFYGYPPDDDGYDITDPPQLWNPREIEGWLRWIDHWDWSESKDGRPEPPRPDRDQWTFVLDRLAKFAGRDDLREPVPGTPEYEEAYSLDYRPPQPQTPAQPPVTPPPSLRPIDPVADLYEDILEDYEDGYYEDIDEAVDDFFDTIFGSCEPGGVDNVSFTGFYAGGINNDRGILATETGTTRVIPGYVVPQNLGGWGVSGSASTCANFASLPTYFSLGGDHSVLTGSTVASNIPFIEGLGITGVGVTPGVFINSPTDITDLRFDTRRNSTRLVFQIDQAIFSTSRIRATGVDEWSAITYTISALGGVSAGRLSQNEVIELAAMTPAFGPAAASTLREEVRFEGMFAGVYVGGSIDTTIAASEGLRVALGLTGSVGVDYYNMDVNDSVTATGLGGALNFTQSNQLSYSLPNLTASTSASIGVGTEHFMISAFGGIDTGRNPSIDYLHPDSVNGVAAAPTFAFRNDIAYTLGARVTGNW